MNILNTNHLKQTKHTPVLLDEVLAALNVTKGEKYIDGTYGLGGHARAIAEKGGIVLGIELDLDSYEVQKQNLEQNITLVQGNFKDIESIAQAHDFVPCSGVLLDLGLSMWHYKDSKRGFSYMNDDEELDMRLTIGNLSDDSETLNVGSTLKADDASNDIHNSNGIYMTNTLKAKDILNSYTEEQLYEISSKYSQEIKSHEIARRIIEMRRKRSFETVGDLKKALHGIGGDSTITRFFQTLRMEVNNELENIKQAINGAAHILKDGGVIVIITFHQTEDRLIKNLARDLQNNQDYSVHLVKNKVHGNKALSFEKTARLRVLEVEK